MTPTLDYLLALLAITFIIDFTLCTLPFKTLGPLRDLRFASDVAVWMPPGIVLTLVLSTLAQDTQEAGGCWQAALVATGVTVAVHLLGGRKLLWSIDIGTVRYVALLNWLWRAPPNDSGQLAGLQPPGSSGSTYAHVSPIGGGLGGLPTMPPIEFSYALAG